MKQDSPLKASASSEEVTAAKTDLPIQFTTVVKEETPLQQGEVDLPRRADTTSEEDRHSLSQRQVNMTWERTQAIIAMGVVATTCIGIFIGRVWIGSTEPFPAEWWTIVGLVIGFYFGRTNHARVGGVQLGR